MIGHGGRKDIFPCVFADRSAMETRVQNKGPEPKVRMEKAVALNQLYRKTKLKKTMLYAKILLCIMPLACQSQRGKVDILGHEENQAQINGQLITSKRINRHMPITNEDTSKSLPQKSNDDIKDKKRANKALTKKSNQHKSTKSDGYKPYHSHKNYHHRRERYYYHYPHKHYHYNPHRHYDDHSHRNYHSSRSHGYSGRSRRR